MKQKSPEFKTGVRPAETKPRERAGIVKVLGAVAVKNANKKK